MPSVRVAATLFGVVNGVMVALWVWYYRSLLEYCEEENLLYGGRGLDCLEPPHWFAINGFLFISLIVEIAVAVVLGAAIVNRRNRVETDGAAPESRHPGSP